MWIENISPDCAVSAGLVSRSIGSELEWNAGDLPLMVACKTASESVLQVLLTKYPGALIYMEEYYSSLYIIVLTFNLC